MAHGYACTAAKGAHPIPLSVHGFIITRGVCDTDVVQTRNVCACVSASRQVACAAPWFACVPSIEGPGHLLSPAPADDVACRHCTCVSPTQHGIHYWLRQRSATAAAPALAGKTQHPGLWNTTLPYTPPRTLLYSVCKRRGHHPSPGPTNTAPQVNPRCSP